jgi:gliding motility-associated-like protein
MKKILFSFFLITGFVGIVSAQTYTGQPNVNIIGSHNVNITCGSGGTCYSARDYHTIDGFSNAYTVEDTIPFASFATTGTAVSANTDDVWSSVITLPFNFSFFCNTYNQIVIGSNGIVSFNTSYANGYCSWPLNGAGTTALPIPNTNLPLNSIMCPYQDIDPAIAGNIKYSVQGTAPRRMFVVSFNSVAQYSCTSLNTTCQLVLYETTNIIDMYITNKPICSTWNNGNAIEGLQNATGTVAYAVSGRNNTQWSATNDAIRFRPSGGNNVQIKWHNALDTITISTADTAQLCPASNSTSKYIVEATYIQCDSTRKVVADSITISVTQSAGVDQYISCVPFNSTATMAASGTGTWTPVPGNPATVNITSPTSPTTTITGFTTLGTYYFVWASASCSDTVAVYVTLRPDAGPDVATCVNGTATMAAIGTGTWTAAAGNPSPTVINSPNSPTTTITGFTVGGTYQFVWYVGTCSDTAIVNVPTFVATASVADTILCKYQSTTLTATAGPSNLGPFTYSWFSPTNVVSPTSPVTATTPLLAPTTYTVLVVSAGGCTLTKSVSVALAGAAPQVHILPSNNNVCPGDTVTLNSLVFAESLVQCGLTDTLFTNNNTVTGYVKNDTASSTGGLFGTSVYCSPFMGSYKSYKAQYLIRKSELNAAGLSSGTITDFAFYIKQLRSTSAYDTFAVSMGCTNLDSLSGFVNNLQEVIPAMIGPYAPTANVSLYANSWNPLPLTHFFNWDGSSNIIVQICYTVPSTSSSADDYVSYSNAFTGASVVAGANNNTNGCNLIQGSGFYSVLNTRPNFLFHVSVPSILTYQWSPATLLCDTCPSTQVVVSTDSTYTLHVDDNGCANDTTIRMLINRNIGITGTPDTTICGGAGSNAVQLNVALSNPPPSTCNQAYNVSSIPYNSISGNITTIPYSAYISSSGGTGSTDDGTAGPYSIGFNFPFYCENFNQFYVNTNGWISFVNPYPASTGSLQYIAQTFPPTAAFLNPQKMVALMVGDYQVAGAFGGGGTIDYFLSGSAPNRILVVQFVGIQSLSGAYNTSGEIQIHETSGIIDILLSSSNYSGTNHTTGIKDSTGIGIAAPGRNNQQYTISTREAWRFTPVSGSSVVLNNTVWSPNTNLSNDSIANPIATPPTSQTYVSTNYLTINQFTNPTTCVVRDTVNIYHRVFNYTLGATPATICPGDTSHLAFVTTDTVRSYAWTLPFGLSSDTIANPNASVLDTTTYHITATDIYGCVVNDSVTVNIFPVQHPVIGPGATICYSDSFRLSLPGGSYSNYQWYFIDTTSGTRTLVSSGPADSVYYAYPSGDYVLQVIPVVGGCPYYTNVVSVDSFTRQQLLIDTSGPTGFCAGGNVVLQAAQGFSNISWTPSSYGSQASFPVTSTGVFSYTANDLHGCLLFSDTVHVNVNQVPTFQFNSYRNPICSSDQDTLIVSTNPAGAQITWTFNGNNTSGDTLIAVSTGTYYLLADLQGCTNTDSVVLTGAPSPTVVLPTFPAVCTCTPNTTVTPLVSSGTPGYTYLWSTGDTTSSVVDQSLNLSTYTVTVTDANHCTAVSNPTSLLMTCINATIVNGSMTDTIFYHDIDTLNAVVTGGSGVYSYNWYSDSASIANPNTNSTAYATVNATGVDTVHLSVIDSATQCPATATYLIPVIQFAGWALPTAFTPNGDGINDYFYPVLSNGANSSAKIGAFRIYNDWGQLVYDSPAAPGWDGFFGNNAQPAGAYTYFITIYYPDPANPGATIQKTVQGSFILLR